MHGAVYCADNRRQIAHELSDRLELQELRQYLYFYTALLVQILTHLFRLVQRVRSLDLLFPLVCVCVVCV